jgi:D-glycero-alpha-D-manno-heptose-7-phosphate kinase
MIISRTPFRISFFGGGTDYPAWYRNHGGAVLATTIDKYCYLTCRYLPPFFEHRIRVVYSRIETCQTVNEIQHPAAREVLRYLAVRRGVEIHHDGDLPARSGIGSSSAFTVGLLLALHALHGRMPSRKQLAEESIEIEQEIMKETVGSQDQVLAAYGGFNHIVFPRRGEISVRPMTLPRERVAELQAHLMLFYTGIRRTASEVAQTYADEVKLNERLLRTLNGLVGEAMAVLTGPGSIAAFGRLLHETWTAKRGLSAKVSNRVTDEIYAQARAAGALGGKLTGAGGGGFMLLFVPPGKQKKVRERLKRLLYLPVAFESGGSQIVFFDPEKDYSGYERLRDRQALSAFRELSDVRS